MFQHTYPVMGGSAIEPFQAALYHRLVTDNVLNQLVPGGIHDLVVSDAANGGRGVAFPYLVLGGATETPNDALTTVGVRLSVPVDIYSQYEGSLELAQVHNRVKQLLHRREKQIVVAGWFLNMLVLDTGQIFREPDNMMHGQFRYTGLLAPIPIG